MWILNSVVCGLSARNSYNLGNIFTVMFPDCKIEKNIFLGRTKHGYSINHGLGPCFKRLTICVKKRQMFSVYHLTRVKIQRTSLQKMDVYVHYFNSVENEAKVGYLESSIMDHTTHEDLIKHFTAV